MRVFRTIPAVAAAALAVGLAVGSATVSADSIDESATATGAATRIGNATQTMEPPPPPAPQTAQYRITLVSEWSSASHPATRPGRSHFSPPVVAVHGQVGDMFAPGTFASPGIEAMAEVGRTSTLVTQLSADGTVNTVRTGFDIFGVGQNQFDVTIAQEAPMVSLVTMLAPSPDWFVGVHDVATFVGGAWVDRVELDLGNYDAGTESGNAWSTAGSPTVPAQAISGPRDGVFQQAAGEGRFGRVVIERLN